MDITSTPTTTEDMIAWFRTAFPIMLEPNRDYVQFFTDHMQKHGTLKNSDNREGHQYSSGTTNAPLFKDVYFFFNPKNTQQNFSVIGEDSAASMAARGFEVLPITHLNRGAPLPASSNSDDNDPADNDPAGNSTSPQGNPNDSPSGTLPEPNAIPKAPNSDVPGLIKTWFQEHILEGDVKKLPIRLWTQGIRKKFSRQRQILVNYSKVYIYLIKAEEPISAEGSSYSKFLDAAVAWLKNTTYTKKIVNTAIELANTEHNKPSQRADQAYAADGDNGAETGFEENAGED